MIHTVLNHCRNSLVLALMLALTLPNLSYGFFGPDETPSAPSTGADFSESGYSVTTGPGSTGGSNSYGNTAYSEGQYQSSYGGPTTGAGSTNLDTAGGSTGVSGSSGGSSGYTGYEPDSNSQSSDDYYSQNEGMYYVPDESGSDSDPYDQGYTGQPGSNSFEPDPYQEAVEVNRADEARSYGVKADTGATIAAISSGEISSDEVILVGGGKANVDQAKADYDREVARAENALRYGLSDNSRTTTAVANPLTSVVDQVLQSQIDLYNLSPDTLSLQPVINALETAQEKLKTADEETLDSLQEVLSPIISQDSRFVTMSNGDLLSLDTGQVYPAEEVKNPNLGTIPAVDTDSLTLPVMQVLDPGSKPTSFILDYDIESRAQKLIPVAQDDRNITSIEERYLEPVTPIAPVEWRAIGLGPSLSDAAKEGLTLVCSGECSPNTIREIRESGGDPNKLSVAAVREITAILGTFETDAVRRGITVEELLNDQGYIESFRNGGAEARLGNEASQQAFLATIEAYEKGTLPGTFSDKSPLLDDWSNHFLNPETQKDRGHIPDWYYAQSSKEALSNNDNVYFHVYGNIDDERRLNAGNNYGGSMSGLGSDWLKKDASGNLVLDANNNPVTQTYSQWYADRLSEQTGERVSPNDPRVKEAIGSESTSLVTVKTAGIQPAASVPTIVTTDAGQPRTREVERQLTEAEQDSIDAITGLFGPEVAESLKPGLIAVTEHLAKLIPTDPNFEGKTPAEILTESLGAANVLFGDPEEAKKALSDVLDATLTGERSEISAPGLFGLGSINLQDALLGGLQLSLGEAARKVQEAAEGLTITEEIPRAPQTTTVIPPPVIASPSEYYYQFAFGPDVKPESLPGGSAFIETGIAPPRRETDSGPVMPDLSEENARDFALSFSPSPEAMRQLTEAATLLEEARRIKEEAEEALKYNGDSYRTIQGYIDGTLSGNQVITKDGQIIEVDTRRMAVLAANSDALQENYNKAAAAYDDVVGSIYNIDYQAGPVRAVSPTTYAPTTYTDPGLIITNADGTLSIGDYRYMKIDGVPIDTTGFNLEVKATGNRGYRQEGSVIDTVVAHWTASNSIRDTDLTFLNPSHGASYHVAIDKDGTIHEYSDLSYRAYGVLSVADSSLNDELRALGMPRPDDPSVYDFNSTSIQIAYVGDGTEPPTQAQREAAEAWLQATVAEAQADPDFEFEIDIQNFTWHGAIPDQDRQAHEGEDLADHLEEHFHAYEPTIQPGSPTTLAGSPLDNPAVGYRDDMVLATANTGKIREALDDMKETIGDTEAIYSDSRPLAYDEITTDVRERALAEADDVLWEAYQRSFDIVDPIACDTCYYKGDQIAAEAAGMSLRDYVIGGIDPEYRLQVAAAAKAYKLDTGNDLVINSGYRGPERQEMIDGGSGTSHHGTLHSYGTAQAVDINGPEAQTWIDANGREYGLTRPYESPGCTNCALLDRPHTAPTWGSEARNRSLGLGTQAGDPTDRNAVVANSVNTILPTTGSQPLPYSPAEEATRLAERAAAEAAAVIGTLPADHPDAIAARENAERAISLRYAIEDNLPVSAPFAAAEDFQKEGLGDIEVIIETNRELKVRAEAEVAEAARERAAAGEGGAGGGTDGGGTGVVGRAVKAVTDGIAGLFGGGSGKDGAGSSDSSDDGGGASTIDIGGRKYYDNTGAYYAGNKNFSRASSTSGNFFSNNILTDLYRTLTGQRNAPTPNQFAGSNNTFEQTSTLTDQQQAPANESYIPVTVYVDERTQEVTLAREDLLREIGRYEETNRLPIIFADPETNPTDIFTSGNDTPFYIPPVLGGVSQRISPDEINYSGVTNEDGVPLAVQAYTVLSSESIQPPILFNEQGEIVYSNGVYAPPTVAGKAVKSSDDIPAYVYLIQYINSDGVQSIEAKDDILPGNFFTNIINKIFSDNSLFSINDVTEVTYELIDPHPTVPRDEYYRYVIRLNDGSIRETTVPEFSSISFMRERFGEVGYQGNVVAIISMARQIYSPRENDQSIVNRALDIAGNALKQFTSIFGGQETEEPVADLPETAGASGWSIENVEKLLIYPNALVDCPQVEGLYDGYVYKAVLKDHNRPNEAITITEARCGLGDPLTMVAEIASNLENTYGITPLPISTLANKTVFNTDQIDYEIGILASEISTISPNPNTGAAEVIPVSSTNTPFIPNTTNTVSFAVKAISSSGETLVDWTTNDLAISGGTQLHFRWDGRDYNQCLPFLNDGGRYSLTRSFDQTMRTGNTESEGYDIAEASTAYRIECGGQDNGEFGVDQRVINVEVR